MVLTQATGMEGSGEMHYFGLTTNLSIADNFFEDNKLDKEIWPKGTLPANRFEDLRGRLGIRYSFMQGVLKSCIKMNNFV